MPHPQIKLLLQIIDEAYDQKAWHGPNLRGSLRGVTAQQAAWRPAPGRHTIREIVLHAAYWKYAVRRRLRRDRRGSFPLKGSNWFAPATELTEKAWRLDLALLEQEHRKMREAAAALPDAALHRPVPGNRMIRWALLCGIAHHDLYHAGQIQLLKRLQTRGKPGRDRA